MCDCQRAVTSIAFAEPIKRIRMWNRNRTSAADGSSSSSMPPPAAFPAVLVIVASVLGAGVPGPALLLILPTPLDADLLAMAFVPTRVLLLLRDYRSLG